MVPLGPLGLDWDGLLSLWVGADLDPSEFWRQTPRRIHIILTAKAELIKERRQEALWHAYHVALLSRQETLPSLESLLAKDAAPTGAVAPAASADEIRSRIAFWRGKRPNA